MAERDGDDEGERDGDERGAMTRGDEAPPIDLIEEQRPWAACT